MNSSDEPSCSFHETEHDRDERLCYLDPQTSNNVQNASAGVVLDPVTLNTTQTEVPDTVSEDGSQGPATNHSDDTERRRPTQESLPMKTDWRSIYAVSAVAFLMTLQQSSLSNALWPYLQQLDPQASESFFGYVMACNSMGHAVAAPLVGWWSNRASRMRLPMVIGKILSITGCLLYISMEEFRKDQRFVLLLVQLLFGLAGGFLGLMRTHIAMASSEEDRAKAISVNTFCAGAGMMTGPGFQMLFTLLGTQGVSLGLGLHFSMYTAPIYLSILANCLGILCLVFVFSDIYESGPRQSLIRRDDDPEPAVSLMSDPQLDKASFSFDLLAVALCLAMRLYVGFFMVGIGTIEVPFTMRMFGWQSPDAVLFNSTISLCTGALSLATNLCYILIPVMKRLNERWMCLSAQSAIILFFLLTFPWPWISSAIPIDVPTGDSSTPSSAFCAWCSSTPAINKYLYLTSFALVNGVAVPFSQVALDSLFSKVLGKIKQGFMQGVFICSGDIVNTVGPVLITALFAATGIRYIWLLMLLLGVSLISTWTIFFKRLVPARSHTN